MDFYFNFGRVKLDKNFTKGHSSVSPNIHEEN